MKLKFLLLAIISASFMVAGAQAAVGDVAGNIYTTDIAADVDGMPIRSYNIGGRTAIVVEDLRDYGFYVEWKEAERLLIVKTERMPGDFPEYVHIKEKPGNVAGKIYETDVKTIVNGIEIPSFNLGGITAVAIEEMVDLPDERYSYDGNAHDGLEKNYADTGMYYVWNADERRISLNSLRPGNVVETDFGKFAIATRGGYSVERITYIRSPKSLAGFDGKMYATYVDALEIDGETYAMLSDLEEILGAEADITNASINLKFNTKNAVQMQYANSLTAKTCDNIMHPLSVTLMVNGNPSGYSEWDFYLYKGDVFVSLSAINSAAEETLFADKYNLPENVGASLGRILYSKDIAYINGKAVATYLADNGKCYIPADELEKAKFVIYTSPDSREVESPMELPGILTSEDNLPSTYFLEDYEGKGYLCEYYEGFHKVRVCGKDVESVYIHFADTHLTPCIALDDLISAGGFFAQKSGRNTFVYTRSDRLTLGVEKDLSAILVYKNGEVAKRVSSSEYHDADVFGEYLVLSATGERFGISEIYETQSLNMLFEIEGTVSSIENERVLAYKNTEVDGDWARRYLVYDMSGKLLETYVDNK